MTYSFGIEENRCESIFQQLDPCWHLYTPENHPVILTCEADFKAAMTILAICAISFPNIRILTFQWMSNHLHITVAGPEEDISLMFDMLKRYLGKYLNAKGVSSSLKDWKHTLRRIGSLKDLRNVIAYNNRNGFLVNPDSTPFTYPWGANSCFFSHDAHRERCDTRKTIHVRSIRDVFHTHKLDGYAGLPFYNGYIPPASFCDIKSAEGVFRDARHYFSLVSRNLESMKAIAKEIGESVFYTDDDLYSAVCEICRKKYDASQPAVLSAQAKMEVARIMYFEYNAGAKQISRILKVDNSVLRSILSI